MSYVVYFPGVKLYLISKSTLFQLPCCTFCFKLVGSIFNVMDLFTEPSKRSEILSKRE